MNVFDDFAWTDELARRTLTDPIQRPHAVAMFVLRNANLASDLERLVRAAILVPDSERRQLAFELLEQAEARITLDFRRTFGQPMLPGPPEVLPAADQTP